MLKKLDYPNYVFEGSPQRITWHWTAGSYTPSSLDAEHYQFLIAYENGKAVTYHGKYSVADQDYTGSDYAAHTKGFNTKNIGISLCGMAGAQEHGTFGNYPLTVEQAEELVKLTAFLCEGYGLATTQYELASHCEIERIHNKPQSGKWDISCFIWSDLTWKELNDTLRSRVRIAVDALRAPSLPPVPPEELDGTVTVIVPPGTKVVVKESMS